MWTHLLEDGILQEIQGREDRVHAIMAYLKKQQKTMPLSKKINTVANMKGLQAEEKVVHV